MRRYFATILLALISSPAWANELDSLLQQAEVLGAPMAAVQRAIRDLAPADFSKKDVFAVFDISQPSANKRFTFWISNQVRSPPTTRRMEETMDPTQKPSNSKASRRTWTWCRWVRSRPLIPK